MQDDTNTDDVGLSGPSGNNNTDDDARSLWPVIVKGTYAAGSDG